MAAITTQNQNSIPPIELARLNEERQAREERFRIEHRVIDTVQALLGAGALMMAFSPSIMTPLKTSSPAEEFVKITKNLGCDVFSGTKEVASWTKESLSEAASWSITKTGEALSYCGINSMSDAKQKALDATYYVGTQAYNLGSYIGTKGGEFATYLKESGSSVYNQVVELGLESEILKETSEWKWKSWASLPSFETSHHIDWDKMLELATSTTGLSVIGTSAVALAILAYRKHQKQG